MFVPPGVEAKSPEWWFAKEAKVKELVSRIDGVNLQWSGSPKPEPGSLCAS